MMIAVERMRKHVSHHGDPVGAGDRVRASHSHEPLVAEYAGVYSFIDVARSVIEPAALAAVQSFDLRDVAVGEPSYLDDTFRLLFPRLRRGEGLPWDHHPQHRLVTSQPG